ncbi:MAG: T9SS type A sorting domain-containing protein [Gemmatimonadetes bacterium]|nr:T9SS type A sorting domain-containing protein [Gemmatimonadota bacterium]
MRPSFVVSCRFGFAVLAFLVSLLPSAESQAASIPDPEALALEFSGELLAPPALVAEIEQDLALVRASNTVLEEVTVSLDWVPGQVIVGLSSSAFAEFQNGTFLGFDALNAQYGPVVMGANSFTETVHFDFEADYHPDVLAMLYGAVAGAAYAEPSYVNFAGVERPDIVMEDQHVYRFEYAWLCDEFTCFNLYYWTYEVLPNGDLVVIDQGGDPPPGVDAPVPSGAGAELAIQASPNPARGAIRLSLSGTVAHESVFSIYDVQGRLVRRLASTHATALSPTATWDGRNEAGRFVPAGAYFVRATAGERVATERLVRIR